MKAAPMKLKPLPGLKQRKHNLADVNHRTVELDYRKANAEARTIPATLSSETPVRRFFGNEVLQHKKGSVDLTRAADGLPLLFNHDAGNFLGVVRGVEVQDGKLRGELQFSENTRAQEVFNDVSSGLLRNMSIGYRIEDYEESDAGDITITRWSLYEASIAPIPADSTVGINRSNEAPTMTTQTIKDAVREAREAETARVAEIRQVFNVRWAEPRHVELRERMITEGATVDQARTELLNMIGMTAEPVNNAAPGEQARDDSDWATRMTDAVAARAGIIDDKEELAKIRDHNEFGGLTIVELARQYLMKCNARSSGPASRVISEALHTRAPGTVADFPSILADVAFKSLLKAYWGAPETWRTWASISAVQDFKVNNRVNLSEFDTLPVVAEGGTYTEGTFTDLSETIQLATYGKIYAITREALINDDLSAFTRIPTAMGLAAARTVGDLVYGVLFTNALLNQDATALFAAGHNNDVAALSGAPPDADTVQAGKVAMALQTGPKGDATLGIMPRYGICPVGLEGTFNTLMSAQYNPASTAGTLEPNVVQGLLTVVSDHRCDGNDAAMWYMAADPMQWDTVDVAFLNGNQTPYQERRQEDITNDNITYKVRLDAAAAAMDFRGLYRNAGA